MRLRQTSSWPGCRRPRRGWRPSATPANSAASKRSTDRRDLDRTGQLADRKLIAADRLDQAATKANLAKLMCSASAVLIREADASLQLQRSLLEQTTLRAPFAGVVAEINGELGEFVTPSPPGIPTPPAVDLIDDSCLYVEAPIDEVDAARVHPGTAVRISWMPSVASISPAASAASHPMCVNWRSRRVPSMSRFASTSRRQTGPAHRL